MQSKSLKILHLFPAYLPQTSNWAYNLIAALPDCEIHIAAKNYLKNDFYHKDFQFANNYYDEFDKMNQKLGKRKGLNILKKVVIKTIPYIFGKVDQVFVDYARKHKIEMIHAHFANIGWEFQTISNQLKIPFVISFYGWDYEKLPFTQPEYKERFRKLFKIADAFICEGNHGASILESYGCPKDKIKVVRLGVHPKKIQVIPRRKATNQLKLVQIASFTEKKGHFYAIEALAKIIKDHPNIVLTLIGNENERMRREKVSQQIKALSLENNVRLLPSIDYKDLYKTLADFDVFIHPSCYATDRDCEGGAPVVLLDAQATGMPIIATTHCDIPDEVVHAKSGLLSPEKNIEALAESMKHFYKMNNETYQEFAQRARLHVEQQYDISENAKKLKLVYDKIDSAV